MWRAREQARLAEEKAKALADRVRGGEASAAVATAEGPDLKQTAPVTRFENAPQPTPSPLVAQHPFTNPTTAVTTVRTRDGLTVSQQQTITTPPGETDDP